VFEFSSSSPFFPIHGSFYCFSYIVLLHSLRRKFLILSPGRCNFQYGLLIIIIFFCIPECFSSSYCHTYMLLIVLGIFCWKSISYLNKLFLAEIKCVQGLPLWRNSSVSINEETFRGYRKGKTAKGINEIVMGMSPPLAVLIVQLFYDIWH
jgi:hypothetical protein